MYGTVARLRLKPGMEGKLAEQMREFEKVKVPGFVGTNIYRMDVDSTEYFMAVAFENKAAYVANANSPEQDARYRKMLDVLAGEPEWHDGEIVYSTKM